MPYVIGVFLVTIIIAIVFILWAFKELLTLKWKDKQPIPFQTIPNIIERAYRAIDFRSETHYIEEKEFNRNLYFDYKQDFSQNIVRDSEHKKYIIRENVIKLADEMLNSGCIEVTDKVYPFAPNPYTRVLQTKVKVYKPDF